MRGREPQPDERNVAIVNAALARRLWPNQDPIGKFLRLGSEQAQREVIGVTATGKYWSLTEPARPFLYQVSDRPSAPMLCLAIRTQGTPGGLAAGLAEDIHRLDPERAGALMLGVLGMAALGLAITGLYALLTQWVAQRTPEIAVRMALGASRKAVVRILLRQSAILICFGAAAGIAVSAAVAHLLASIAGQVNPLDGITVVGVVALLALVGAAATLVPAYRAAGVDPVSALRAE